MHEHRANVVIHVDEALTIGRMQELERSLGAEEGVISACVSDRATHLMVVDFDADAVSAAELLHRVELEGVHAELIGL